MVVVFQNTKFACANCQKGHRSQSCDHLHRILGEIKQKGRPTSQCHHCRAKRSTGTGHSHHKCLCGDPPADLRPRVEVKLNSGSTFVLTCPEAPESFRAKLAEIRNLPITVHHKPKGKNENGFDPATNGVTPPIGLAGGDPLQPGFVITEWKADFVSCNILQDSLQSELDALSENPCKCHDGSSPCICASIAKQKSRSSSKSAPPPRSIAKTKNTSPPVALMPSNSSSVGTLPQPIPIAPYESSSFNNAQPYPALYNAQQPSYSYSYSQPPYQSSSLNNSQPYPALYNAQQTSYSYGYSQPPVQPYVTNTAYPYTTQYRPPSQQQANSDPRDMEGASALIEMFSNIPGVANTIYASSNTLQSLPVPPPHYHQPAMLPPQTTSKLSTEGATVTNDSQAIRCCVGGCPCAETVCVCIIGDGLRCAGSSSEYTSQKEPNDGKGCCQ